MWKQPYTTDLNLMDEKGERIHAVVKKQLIPTFEPILEQGFSVVIAKFGIAKNGDKYPILNHPYKLMIALWFSLYSFADILNKEVVVVEDVDVIGNVVSCGNLDVYNNHNGKEQKRMTVELQDLGGAWLELWKLWNLLLLCIHVEVVESSFVVDSVVEFLLWIMLWNLGINHSFVGFCITEPLCLCESALWTKLHFVTLKKKWFLKTKAMTNGF
ncbi:nucleic acid-binding, OB-fold protein [Artemisia annua]|uniref:Nucleic acid-binding, OB-fold protein n=1 Tax=Artemisia annua TaxID=35608 RepID=A0A2U1QKD4_ARTAN|nr:nucleic acid-binding, OB-fold protein [Artemisia annua]